MLRYAIDIFFIEMAMRSHATHGCLIRHYVIILRHIYIVTGHATMNIFYDTMVYAD